MSVLGWRKINSTVTPIETKPSSESDIAGYFYKYGFKISPITTMATWSNETINGLSCPYVTSDIQATVVRLPDGTYKTGFMQYLLGQTVCVTSTQNEFVDEWLLANSQACSGMLLTNVVLVQPDVEPIAAGGGIYSETEPPEAERQTGVIYYIAENNTIIIYDSDGTATDYLPVTSVVSDVNDIPPYDPDKGEVQVYAVVVDTSNFTVVPEEPDTTDLITFNINDNGVVTSHQAEAGMTLEEWATSVYNDSVDVNVRGGPYNSVAKSDWTARLDVKASDVIVEGATYSFKPYIMFYIENNNLTDTYYADEGITWREWVTTYDNTEHAQPLELTTGTPAYVSFPNGGRLTVDPDDPIVAGTRYESWGEIAFYIKYKTETYIQYYGSYGMTWRQWIASEYNDNLLKIETINSRDCIVFSSDNSTYLDARPDGIIIGGGTYYYSFTPAWFAISYDDTVLTCLAKSGMTWRQWIKSTTYGNENISIVSDTPPSYIAIKDTDYHLSAGLDDEIIDNYIYGPSFSMAETVSLYKGPAVYSNGERWWRKVQDREYVSGDAGLYDADDNLVASWDELTTIYGMVPSDNYDSSTYKTSLGSPYYVLKNNDELSTGVKMIVGGDRIGHYAFYKCDLLTNIIVSDTVSDIGKVAFGYCLSLQDISLGMGITDLGSGDSKGIFYKCDSLTSVTIPKSVTHIYSSAFYDCDSLTSVTIPDSVGIIGNNAFRYCGSLTSVTIPDSVTSIGENAFLYCKSLTSVTIPDSVTTIGDGAFADCPVLTNILIDDNNKYYTTIDGNIYTKSGTQLVQYLISKTNTSFIVPNSVTNIYAGAFYNCDSLMSVQLPDGLGWIKDDTFYDCDSLTSITIPDSVGIIGNNAFYSCKSLTSVTFPKGGMSIGDSAFAGCSSLTSITIPGESGSISIGDRAFASCTSLTSVTIPKSVREIGHDAFDGCSGIKNVYYGGDISDWLNMKWGNKITYDTDPGTPMFSTTDAKLYFNGELVTTVTIPDTCTSIKDYAFYKVCSLTHATIPDSVTAIGSSAFYKCDSLTSVTIGSSVSEIESYVFYGCTALKNITFNGTVEQWEAITKRTSWKYNVPATYVQCTDGQVAL